FLLLPLTSGEIVKFELAKQPSVAEGMIQNWVAEGKFNKAIESVYIDFLFIILYTAGLSFACVYLSIQTRHEILIRTGHFFSYLMIFAGICDIVENICLLKNLQNTVGKWSTSLAYDMAVTKFSIIILSILFIAICLIFWAIEKMT